MKNRSHKFPILVKEIREIEGEYEEFEFAPVDENQDTLNYNDRLDGYGFGEADSKDCDREYEKDPHFTQHNIDLGEGYRCHKDEPYTKDEYGLRNQYGPVDQYVFRDTHLYRKGFKEKKDMPPKEKR